MPKGRKKIPTVLKAIRGGRHMDKEKANERHGLVEPKGEVFDIIGDAPEVLGVKASRYWPMISRQLEKIGVLQRLDAATLALYCEQFVIYKEALDNIAKHSYMLVNPRTGMIVPNPAVRMVGSAHDRMFRICCEFGMTPASRAKLLVPKETTRQNKFAAIAGGK